MGSGANSKSIDPTVGGLVWVRRRNGSWWPGRILGPDELPESCLVSPRSGTPVKLLGREDASVDWYNLEKSKRVKAFRCGEYDECIEKAKITAAISCKKAVKYARREDAILHALELESSRLSKDRPETCSQMETSGGKQPDVEESPTCFHTEQEAEGMSDKLSGLEYISNSPQELSQGGVSLEDPCRTDHSLQGRRRRTPNDSEDDGAEGSKKRMRGLEDLGISGTSSFKRRRSQVAHVHEFLKKKNRRRQLTKVLESTAMVTVPVMCEQLTGLTGSFLPSVSDNQVLGLECNESKRSFSAVINNNSESTGDASNNATGHAGDISPTNCKQKENEISSISDLLENDSCVRLFDVPFIGEEKHTAGFSPIAESEKPRAGAGAQSGQSSLVETVSVGHDEIQESGSISSGAVGINDISHRIDNKGTSKWQHKGKRNSRNKSKTIQKFLNADVLDAEANVFPSRTDSVGHEMKSEQVIESHHTVEVTLAQRLLPYRQSRFTVNPKYQSSDLAYRKHDIGSLYDVNIEVETGHRPQHVPYISLMSKLTGQPITGHPLVVEVLDNAVSDLSLNGSECHSSSCELDGDVGMVQEAPKKPRNGLLSNKKIRMLSSLTGSKRPNETGKFKKPGLACVPLTIVFGRINAALGISSTPSMNFTDAGGTR